ncbi:MAG: nicotinate-nicotinamide nucleotide adenylyltransferase [Planctomycetota bacterium]|nr:MAG: nicotinate-nicotinamide nucleotide adenylyltransferase [Planctomycetota bacterium]
MRIALFGGSFDPPHLGHVYAALHAYVVGDVDEVWVLPVAHHPYGKALSPFQQRWELARAAFGELPGVRLSDAEQDNLQGHTITLIESLMDRHPGTTWVLVGGSDTEADLINWHRGPELTKLVEVHAVPRRGYDDHPAALPELSSTLIRQYIAAGNSIHGLVPREVERLIANHRWYQLAAS